jgi:hypothetical protein
VVADEARIQLARAKGRMGDDAAQQGQVAGRAEEFRPLQRPREARQGHAAIRFPNEF